MATSVQGGEKQLFEKFWQGTFKAVATPRPGSIIVASITSRKPRASTEASGCLSLPTGEKPLEGLHPAQETSNSNGCARLKDSEAHLRNKSHSLSCNEESTLPPIKGKKKKKKSTRKKRRRSPSCSLSPLKKKKKKKHSKKRKRNRLSSKKRRHSSSSPKSKRKEDRKHKKHSRGRSQKSHRHHHHRRRRHCRSGSESTSSLSESCGSRPRARYREKGHKTRWKRSRRSLKSARKPDAAAEVTNTPSLSCPLQNNRFPSIHGMISKTGVSADLFQKAEGQVVNPVQRNGEPHENDSGNDTSSPPSNQTSTSRSKGKQEASCPVHDDFGNTFSSASSGSSSDSGNSFTSCFSRTKGATREDLAPSLQIQSKSQRSSPASRQSHSSHHKTNPRSSQSRSYSSGTRDREEEDHKYSSGRKESHGHHGRQRRKQSYSPLRKRRRDSPSHLEARRITSARKRPIPYYRPSPSSSSSSSMSTYSSWYSCYSHSPGRSRSYSSSRTSRSRSWSSDSSSRSHSRSSAARNSWRSGSRSSESAGSYDSMRR
uniref:Serine/arginine repetitive matrix protein 4 isoform X2 n=1 Tax=Pogona vitticeps TaxID=103695 RepID=A0ABM5F1E3_9SAUR